MTEKDHANLWLLKVAKAISKKWSEGSHTTGGMMDALHEAIILVDSAKQA